MKKNLKESLVFCLLAALGSTSLAASPDQPSQTVYGQYYGVVVSDPAALATAMQQYRQSPTGKKLTSNVTLAQSLANGEDEATHTIAVFYGSAEAMAANLELQVGSDDWAAFLGVIENVTRIETENVFTVRRSRINDESVGGVGSVTMLFGLNVTDQPRFMAAIDAIFDSQAAASFPGNLNFGQIIAMGDTPGTHWVSFAARDLATLLTGVEAFMSSADFAAYARDANEFREVTGRYISRNVLTLAPPQG